MEKGFETPSPYCTSPAILMRDKDALDRSFLRKLLEDRGEWPVA